MTLETLSDVLDSEVEQCPVPDEMANFVAKRIATLLAGDPAGAAVSTRRARPAASTAVRETVSSLKEP
jgi:hypothetical protein